jgi:2-desacetyl-2-hydroxyethyl bacteriochlorophyllide A dehydrogenase
MKAMVLDAYHGPPTWRDVPDPTIGSRDVLVKVRAAGLCATDLKIVDGLVPGVSLPHVPGHEAAGEIAEVGAEVAGLAPGDHVTLYPTVGCGSCDPCRVGRENLCLKAPRIGFEMDGGFAEYVRAPARNAVKIDPSVPLTQAAVLPDAVATCYHALTRKAMARAGETVVVVGVGGLGIHAVQLAKLMGTRVIAADVEPDKLAAAEGFGAETADVRVEALPTQIDALTHGAGADVVVECVGGSAVSGVLSDGLKCLKLNGRLMVVGYAYGAPLSIDTAELIHGQWNVVGTRASTLQDVVDVVRLVESGRLKPVVSETMAMEGLSEALETLRRNPPVGRIVLTA